VRRRRARWRSFRSDRTARFHGEEELPAEKIPTPGLLDLFTYADDDLGERGFDRSYDDRAAARVALSAILIVLAVAALLLWLTVWYVLPWLLPLVAAHARLLLTVAGALAVVVPVLASPTTCCGPGTWSCSARAWPTPRGGCGGSGDGGGAVA
jgi:Flp pilus assembly protein TadB